MRSHASDSPRVRSIHPLQWAWEPLEADPTFLLRSMFGTKAVYLGGKLMLCFCHREEPWRGILVCTERTSHSSLLADFSALILHPILPKWLYLPLAAPQFERAAIQLVHLARQRDVRLGVVSAPRKKKSRDRAHRPK